MSLVILGGGRMYVPNNQFNYKTNFPTTSTSVLRQLSNSQESEEGAKRRIIRRNTQLTYSNRLDLQSLGYNIVSPSI